jgi:hypothetical protein
VRVRISYAALLTVTVLRFFARPCSSLRSATARRPELGHRAISKPTPPFTTQISS